MHNAGFDSREKSFILAAAHVIASEGVWYHSLASAKPPTRQPKRNLDLRVSRSAKGTVLGTNEIVSLVLSRPA